MKKIFLLPLFILLSHIAGAVINASDTLVFDLSHATCTSSFFIVPVSFKSDDVVFAIDFSMKYTLTKVSYNSIINYYPGSVSSSANYNTGDSTLRFTSFSLTTMAHDTPIVSVRFNLLLSPVMVSDFNTIQAYLNGDACSYKVIPPTPATIASSGPTVINTGDTLTLTGTQGSGLTYLWSTNATTPSINITNPGIYTVTVTTQGGCTSSTAINISPGSPLPIELVNFTATKNNNAVLLEWTTASEVDNNYFTIEKTQDGNPWHEVEKIPGAGNSSTVKNYSVTDTQPFAGINYYRLKQTDFDGTFSYSGIVSVNLSEQSLLSVFVYPNPANELLSISANEIASYQLLDATGHSVRSMTNISAKASQQIDTSELANGIYLLKIANENGSVMKKIVIEK